MRIAIQEKVEDTVKIYVARTRILTKYHLFSSWGNTIQRKETQHDTIDTYRKKPP